MTTSKKRFRARRGDKVTPWFKSRDELSTWLMATEWRDKRVFIEEGSAIRRTKATDARKRGHTHPPGSTKCRVCGV